MQQKTKKNKEINTKTLNCSYFREQQSENHHPSPHTHLFLLMTFPNPTKQPALHSGCDINNNISRRQLSTEQTMSTHRNLEKQELPASECRSGGILQVPAWGTISVFYTAYLPLATLLLVFCL